MAEKRASVRLAADGDRQVRAELEDVGGVPVSRLPVVLRRTRPSVPRIVLPCEGSGHGVQLVYPLIEIRIDPSMSKSEVPSLTLADPERDRGF